MASWFTKKWAAVTLGLGMMAGEESDLHKRTSGTSYLECIGTDVGKMNINAQPRRFTRPTVLLLTSLGQVRVMRARGRLDQRQAHEEYQDYRQPMQAKWRPLILDRDKKCRVCGDRGKDEPLHMAHITDARYFVKIAKNKEAVTFSFRWDNLYMLCATCHRISHKFRPTPEELPRRVEVEAIEESLRKLRGWSTAAAVLPPNLVPERLRPRKSFHDTMRITPLVPFPTFAKYASDGGIVFRDEEAPPLQSQLIVENEE